MTIKEQNESNNINTVSLFSGAGGLDIGARYLYQALDRGLTKIPLKEFLV